jgi:hypothetical protein
MTSPMTPLLVTSTLPQVMWLRQCCDQHLPMYTNLGGTKKKETLNPYLAEILSGHRTWKKCREKREPLMGAILDTMARMAADASSYGISSKNAALYNWSRLGLFTGSSLTEYGQSVLPEGNKADGWDRLPTNHVVPKEWRGKPRAFVTKDFHFYDKHIICIPHTEAICNTAQIL